MANTYWSRCVSLATNCCVIESDGAGGLGLQSIFANSSLHSSVFVIQTQFGFNFLIQLLALLHGCHCLNSSKMRIEFRAWHGLVFLGLAFLGESDFSNYLSSSTRSWSPICLIFSLRVSSTRAQRSIKELHRGEVGKQTNLVVSIRLW